VDEDEDEDEGGGSEADEQEPAEQIGIDQAGSTSKRKKDDDDDRLTNSKRETCKRGNPQPLRILLG
jgi:hypothetical protein